MSKIYHLMYLKSFILGKIKHHWIYIEIQVSMVSSKKCTDKVNIHDKWPIMYYLIMPVAEFLNIKNCKELS